MKKLITFSLWGNDPLYVEGAFLNAKLAEEIYPEWICRYYIAGKNTTQSVIQKIKTCPNTEVVIIDEKGGTNFSMNRFTACDDSDVECFISRNTDSRLSYREKEAVDEWLKSDKGFHIMRDHPNHVCALMPGMWGMKCGRIKGMKKKIDRFVSGGYIEDKKGSDKAFLWGLVWPLAMEDNVTHDSYYTENAEFPDNENENDHVSYVGERIEI